jgi:hypothetical protein
MLSIVGRPGGIKDLCETPEDTKRGSNPGLAMDLVPECRDAWNIRHSHPVISKERARLCVRMVSHISS